MAIYALPFADEERRLLDRCFDADDEAFDSIYRTYKPALLAFCRSRLTDRSEAEDACQEALLRAYRSLPRFDRTQRLWPWLATIAANICTDMRRKKLAMPLSACGDDPRRGATVEMNDVLEARSRQRFVGAVLQELPETYRRPVYLADGEGWSYADIATHEDRSVASVRTSLMRGRTAFKERARAMAEERGMWPLSAVLPISALRARFLAWRAKDAGSFWALAPGAFTFAQAAAATIAVLATVVPAAASGGGRVEPVMGFERTASTSEPTAPTTAPHDGASTAGGPAGSGPVVTPPVPGAATATAVDLDGDRRLVHGTISWDIEGDGEDDGSIWLAAASDCDSDAWREQCEEANAAIDELPDFTTEP